MLGDTAVAVHPDDERYRAIVGKKVRHPLTGREIPIVPDAILVDPKFGTGAVKVTPAHDFNDFEVGKRHGLEQLTVIGLDGRMTAEAGPVAGLDRFEARKKVKELVAAQGLDRGAKPHALPPGRARPPGRSRPPPPAPGASARSRCWSRSSPISGTSGSSRSRAPPSRR